MLLLEPLMTPSGLRLKSVWSSKKRAAKNYLLYVRKYKNTCSLFKEHMLFDCLIQCLFCKSSWGPWWVFFPLFFFCIIFLEIFFWLRFRVLFVWGVIFMIFILMFLRPVFCCFYFKHSFFKFIHSVVE